jgi:hypothetical protein
MFSEQMAGSCNRWTSFFDPCFASGGSFGEAKFQYLKNLFELMQIDEMRLPMYKAIESGSILSALARFKNSSKS